DAAREAGAVIVGGHSGYSSGLSRPLAAVTAFGDAREETLVRTDGAREGDVICLTRGMGLEGTAILAWDYPEECRRRGLSEKDVTEAKKLAEALSVVPEALRLAELGATAMHDPTRGGVLEAFLEMAWGAKKSFRIQEEQLPSLPVVANFARAFDFDPLRMISSGALVVTLPEEKVTEASRAIAPWAPLYPVGVVEEGKGVRICSGSEGILFSEPEPEKDELARLQALLGAPGEENN
ncbi:MAG TPA: AIR synthase-related protein, partial [Synergistaceae bacterium]|nr:AIR synthase-related protein [Synergistaceae bacterium]